MNSESNFIPYLQLSLAMIIVGSATVFGKIIVSELPIFFASFLSLLLASILFLSHVFLKYEKYRKITRKDFGVIFLQALLGTFLYRILLMNGLRYITATEAGIITSTLPAMVVVLAIIILKEKVTKNSKIGIGLTMLGVFFVSSFVKILDRDITVNVIFGTLFVIASVVCEALFSVLAKKLHPKVDPVAQSGLVIFISTLLFLPFALFETNKVNIDSINFLNLVAVTYYGVVVTVVSFVLWFKGLKKVSASNSGIFMGLIPISGANRHFALVF